MNSSSVQGKALPNGWHEVKLGKVASVKTGPFGAQLHQYDYVKSDGTPIVTVEHLSESGLVHENLPLVGEHDKKRLSQFLVQEGDILFSRVGSVDRSSLVSEKEAGWLFSGRLLRVRPDNRIIDSRYLRYFFSLGKFKHHMRSIAVGGTMPSLNTAILSNVKVSHPAIFQQRKIADLLNQWDTAIEKTERLIAAKEKQFKWLLKRLISDQQDNLEWQKVKLGKLCAKILGGGTPSTANTDYWKGQIPWMTSADIVDFKTIKVRKYITAQAVTESATSLIPKNNIIIVTRVGLGKAVKNEIDICISQDSQGLILKKSVSADFLIHCLLEKIKVFKSASQGSTIQGITKKRLFDIDVSLPSIPQQRQIAQQLDIVEREIDLLKKFAEKSRTQKRGLMEKLLTREWKVQT